VSNLLEPLRDEALPPSSVDLAGAMAAGHRRVLARRSLAIVTAGLTVIGIAIGVGAAVRSPTAARPAPIAPATTSASPSLPAAAPTAFDPMARYAAFGWLPSDFTVLTAVTRADQFVLQATHPGVPDGDRIELRMVPAGHDILAASADGFSIPLGLDVQGPLLEAPPVNGRTAWWNTSGPDLGLRWEYAPGAWAEVLVEVESGDPKTIARQVAESLRYGVNEPVRLPFSLTPPSSMRPERVIVTTGKPSWEVRVGYGDRDAHGDWPLDILMFPWKAEDGYANMGTPDTTVDGHPARMTTGIGGALGLQVYGVQGLYLEMYCTEPSLVPDGLEPVFRAITLHPDPSSWR
jgi:hypothetical protein